MKHDQKEKRCLVFIGAEGPRQLQGLPDVDLVLAADSGYALCKKLGFEADVVMGDMDSIDPQLLSEIPPSVQVKKYSTEKDQTDTELCIEYAQEHGCTDISIVGGGGGRIDHVFALLSLFGRAHSPARMITEDYQIEYVTDAVELDVGYDTCVSVFSCVGQSARVRSTGLYWSLDSLELSQHRGGLSNKSTAKTIRLELISGGILVMWEHKDRILQARRP